MALNLDEILKQLENSIGVTAYIDDSLVSEQVSALKTQLEDMSHITEVDFISSEDAYNGFISQLGGSSIFNDINPEEILPRSFEIEIESSRFRSLVIEELSDIEGISLTYVDVTPLKNINKNIRYISMFLFIDLFFISIVVIMNTIKLTVSNRRIEINIMKYVGATDWFVRWPFIIEGVLIGIVGSFLSLIICFFSYLQVLKFITGSASTTALLNIQLIPLNRIFIFIVPVAVLFGMLIGAMGAMLSMRKYLKV
jgi:cell division transport system permease protein